MGRFQSVWGPDAGTYDPSRWIDEKGQLKKESQWKAHFFNGGARACPGKPSSGEMVSSSPLT